MIRFTHLLGTRGRKKKRERKKVSLDYYHHLSHQGADSV